MITAWVLLGLASATGLLALAAIPMMIWRQNYNLEDPYLTWPIRAHHVCFIFGIVLLGVALAASLRRGDPPKPGGLAVERKDVGIVGPEHIGAFASFPLGSAELDPKNQAFANEMGRVIDRWKEGRSLGKTGVLLIAGSADRVPLTSDTRRQYDANLGVSGARAEAIKTQLLAQTRDLGDKRIREEDILTLVSGPRNTPAVALGRSAGRNDGFAEDRRVDVWVFWRLPANALHDHPSSPPAPER